MEQQAVQKRSNRAYLVCCLVCKSEQTIRKGLRHNKYGGIQRFKCLACGKYIGELSLRAHQPIGKRA